jgi:hypothetical protein
VLLSVVLPLAGIMLTGLLTTRFPSRRSHVRTAGLAVELLLLPLGIWQLLYGSGFGNVFAVLMPAAVITLLCTPSTRTWFNR